MDPVITNGNVMLVDPNLVNVNQDMINGIPQYQDMYIFAELTAKRRGRTVLVTTAEGTSKLKTGLEDNVSVNFLGNNQDKNNPNYLNFTTNWYDGSSEQDKQYEGFGIGSIKVVINSSFIPQVNIQFIDLRGLAFFNQPNSPYRIIFDFPPPIFELTIKGYYGRPITYKLHLVNYTSEFNSQNGNFIIDAKFVAVTYAPLTDLLFRYIVNFPLMEYKNSINPNPEDPPKNTYELIMKIKALFTQYNDKKNSDVETQKLENTITSIENTNTALEILNNYSENEILKSNGKPLLFIRNTQYKEEVNDNNKELTLIDNIGIYSNNLKEIPTDGLNENISQRLVIAFQIGNELISLDQFIEISGNDRSTFLKNNVLGKYRAEILGRFKSSLGGFIGDVDIPEPKEMFNKQEFKSVAPKVGNAYIVLDITNAYIKLYKRRTALQASKTNELSAVNEVINDMVVTNLGMKPTIYNIFKIILHDVDVFFNKLRSVSYDAESRHHPLYYNQIVKNPNFQDAKKNDKEIFAFPLVIKEERVCDQVKQTRGLPLFEITEQFPELTLVEDFIETFITQEKITALYNLKAEQNGDGSFKWIPISPVDSRLANDSTLTPYFGVDNTNGGSAGQPINLSTNPLLTEVFERLLRRYYILSQNAFGLTFYNNNKTNLELVKLYGSSEAVNLAASITNLDYTNLLENASKEYGTKRNVNAFYDYLNKYVGALYTGNTETFHKILGGNDLYTNKSDGNYDGLKVYYTDDIVTRVSAADSSNPVDKFLDTLPKSAYWERFMGGNVDTADMYKFTQENVFYIKDENTAGDSNFGNVNVNTRFLVSPNNIYTPADNSSILHFTIPNNVVSYAGSASGAGNITSTEVNKDLVISNASKFGNNGIKNSGVQFAMMDYESINVSKSIVGIWADQLTKYDTEIYSSISTPSKFSALMFLSNLGYSISPFSYYPNNLIDVVFKTPAVVEVPKFLPQYMGGLVGINDGDDLYNQIYDFFNGGAGRNIENSGIFILADIYDINNNLASKDKDELQNSFNIFFGDGGGEFTVYGGILDMFKNLYAEAQAKIADVPEDKKGEVKGKFYYENLGPNGTYFQTIILPLIDRINLINFSQYTFSNTKPTPATYTSLLTQNANNEKKDINNLFFETFFTRLATEINLKKQKLANEEKESKKLMNDEDIMTELYYSFKNINDKWVSSPQSGNLNMGYPFNTKSKIISNTENSDSGEYALINSFAFVDRAMNPIGDTIINPEVLVDLLEDPNATVFTVLTQLLSINGFEFFPLQNFMNFSIPNEWKESFIVDASGILTGQTSSFVCMYIGGSSSYPSGIDKYLGGQFKDDGILDISNPGTQDFFFNGDCGSVPTDDNQTATNTSFPYRQVRAFRVRFGEQNQSMFSGIKIDSKEYPETNESIQILSRLAGDNKKNAPPPKGQNLYNLYENRAYKATVTGLGNAMIQPTQYFQVENIPIYNGAYLILNVEHQIDPNKMITSFSGTKILKFPIPRVLESSAIVGFNGGNTDNTSSTASSASSVTAGVGTAGNLEQSKYNSMYEFKIQ